MRQLALLVVVLLGIISLSAVSTQAATPPTGRAKAMQQVDQLLDRAIRNLNAAEELSDKKQMAAADKNVDQVVRIIREAERKIAAAQAMFRDAEAGKLTKAQLEQVERLMMEARVQLREAEKIMDRVAKKTSNHKLLSGLVKGAGLRVDQAAKMLRQIAAGL